MSQSVLASELMCVKQNVSKWVLRERKIAKDSIPELEEKLGVPSRFFVGVDGYCKELNEDEVVELELYLLNEPFGIDESEDVNLRRWIDERRTLEERKKAIYHDIKKLNKDIEEDILSAVQEMPINSEEEWIESVEDSINFYRKTLKLKESHRITDREWTNMWKALSVFLLPEEEHMSLDSDTLAGKLYQVIAADRKAIEHARVEALNDYKEIFGELPLV